jgi:PAS domain S-box-containing protein
MAKIKKQPPKKLNLLKAGIGFGLFYWILESVRDVVTFGKGTLIERFFFPGQFTFWMRLLVLCVLILFAIYAQSHREKTEERRESGGRFFAATGMIWVGIGFGAFYWLLESVRDVFVFHKGNLLERIVFPDSMSFLLRLLPLCVIILSSIYAQNMINERKKAETALLKARDELEAKVKERTADLSISNESLIKEMEERKRAEAAAVKERHTLRTLIDNLPDLIYIKDAENRYITGNMPAALLMGTKTPDGLTGKTDFDFFPKQLADRYRADELEIMRSGLPLINTEESQTAAAAVRKQWISTSKFPLRDGSGKIVGIVGISRDITEQKQAEENIKKSLLEKELLSREIHHRVKNNLQVISSLLDMSAMRLHDPGAIGLLTDAGSKIQTMAFIHSQLYRSEHFDRIEMKSHIQKILNYLSSLYSKGKTIDATVEVSDIQLSITEAIPCTLILTELISNSYKHAFQQGEKGTIEISMKKSSNDTVSMRIKDDGIGLPDEVDIARTDSLGLKLVRTLVQKQLKGKIQVNRKKGTEYTIEFKVGRKEENEKQEEDDGRVTD